MDKNSTRHKKLITPMASEDYEDLYSEEKETHKNGRWAEDEHKRFTTALEKHGKNWKRIQECVKTRTASQVRSHAQKYFQKNKRFINIPSSSSNGGGGQTYNSTKYKHLDDFWFIQELFSNPEPGHRLRIRCHTPGKTYFLPPKPEIDEEFKKCSQVWKKNYTPPYIPRDDDYGFYVTDNNYIKEQLVMLSSFTEVRLTNVDPRIKPSAFQDSD